MKYNLKQYFIKFDLKGVVIDADSDVATVFHRKFTSKQRCGERISEFSFQFGPFPPATRANLLCFKKTCVRCLTIRY